MATEDDNVSSGALGTLLSVGTFATLGIMLVVTALVRSEMSDEAAKKDVGVSSAVHDLVSEQSAKLNAPAAYIDRGQGLVSLPIDRAMELVVSGLKKDPNSATPPAPPAAAGSGGMGGSAAEAGAAGGSGGSGGTAPGEGAAPREEAAPAEAAKPAEGDKKDAEKKDGEKKDGEKKDKEKKEAPKPKPVPVAPAPAAPAPAPAAPAPAPSPNGQ